MRTQYAVRSNASLRDAVVTFNYHVQRDYWCAQRNLRHEPTTRNTGAFQLKVTTAFAPMGNEEKYTHSEKMVISMLEYHFNIQFRSMLVVRGRGGKSRFPARTTSECMKIDCKKSHSIKYAHIVPSHSFFLLCTVAAQSLFFPRLSAMQETKLFSYSASNSVS